MKLAKDFLPICKEDLLKRNIEQLDFIIVTGDAYVDHPSFGTAIIGRTLEAQGFKVGVIAQPNWNNADDFKKLGKPKYAFLVNSGNIDSMVNHYTAAKKKRHDDFYSPGGKSGYRPDRAVIVYCNRVREAYKDVPIVIGGIEASLRRFAHYDYWDNKVRRSILVDSKADLLIYGMGEKTIVQIAEMFKYGASANNLTGIRGTCYLTKDTLGLDKYITVPSFEEVSTDTTAYGDAFKVEYYEQDPIRGNGIIQKHGDRYLVQNPPQVPLTNEEMNFTYDLPFMRTYHPCYEKLGGIGIIQKHGDRYLVQNPPQVPLTNEEMNFTYDLPFMRTYHPCYEKLGGIPAIQEVKFSITSHRGCYGSCSFCALTFHQGRIIQTRDGDSIVDEAKLLTTLPDFKGYIHDVGGPTADFRHRACNVQKEHGACKHKQCMFPKPCKNLIIDHKEYLSVLRRVRSINFRHRACNVQKEHGACKHKQCMFPKPCKNLIIDHKEYLSVLRRVRSIKGIKKVFVRSGLRYDYMIHDKDDTFFKELCEHHISGQLKVAPEHVTPRVLAQMGKPTREVYDRFVNKYFDINKKLGKKQYLVPYLMSSHPGSDLNAAIELAQYVKSMGYTPEQVQDFYS